MSELQFKPVGGTLPTIAIPENMEWENDWANFCIGTNAGTVAVSEWGDRFQCVGSAKALIAAGIMHPDWITVDKSSWIVTFAEGIPLLRLGGRGGTKKPYASIRAKKGDEYWVFVTMTLEQQREINARREEKRAREQAAYESGYQFGSLAGSMTSDERFLLAGFRACSAERRDTLLDIARRGYVKRAESARPKYRTEGNVIFWPGRGSVAPVSLS